jgi:hypothetical protein
MEAIMNPSEAHARATIAAALIIRGAVEIPSLPANGDSLPDPGGLRLRELTEYLYRLITTDEPREPA